MNYKFRCIISALIFSSIILVESIVGAEGTDNKILLTPEVLDLFKITITDNSTGRIFESKSDEFRITLPTDWFIGPKLLEAMSSDKQITLIIMPTTSHSSNYNDIATEFFGKSNDGFYTYLKTGKTAGNTMWILGQDIENNLPMYMLAYTIPGINHDYWVIFRGPFSNFEKDLELCNKIVMSFAVLKDTSDD